ncbi:WHG domain protein [Leptospira ryugenii]|uniref:WHG domain protein n=1 Tax=Leptospira ryugenii TaxID=1917863 RepID=A0A2P2DYZ3_9LEPT|nr:TetR/AcrR family transcriptional regulator [Leptospira ryugenii]GBF49851.1 WHG domain protein [Leptospira ryugenii]
MGKKLVHKTGRPRKETRVLNRELITDAAWALANQFGVSGFSLKDLAERLNIRSPSLYNHIQDLGEVQRELSARALLELNRYLVESQMSSQNKPSKERFQNFCASYRKFAATHPKVYETILGSPKENESHKKAAEQTLRICQDSLGLKVLDSEAVHKIRILRATLHGFVSIEFQSGFGLKESVEESFQWLVQMLYEQVVSR